MARADVELLEQWRAGDVTAGEALFEHYFDPVVRFFRNKVADATDDLVQRTFLACVEGRDRLRADASFRSYLFAVAHNQLRRHYEIRRGDERIDFTVRSAFDLGTSPSSAVARSQAHRLVLDALRRIPLEYQIALELHYWEDMTAAEIASAIDVPVGTAKTRVRRGRALLQDEIAELVSVGEAGLAGELDASVRAARSALLTT